MKKTVFSLLLLMLICTVSLSACRSGDETTVSTELPADEGYLDLECRSIFAMDSEYFGFDGDTYITSIAIPEDWRASGDIDSGYRFERSGEEVASLVSGEPDIPAGHAIIKTSEDEGELSSCKWSIVSNLSETDAEKKYSHRFVYSYTAEGETRTLTLTAPYTELDDFAQKCCALAPKVRSKMSDAGFGTVPLDPAKANKPILILGNSFISTSNIGFLLQEMCDMVYSSGYASRTYTIEARSRGYANVSSWSDMLEPIRRGEYSVVFMCGFYSTGDEQSLQPYYEACLEADVPLVIFPAHNETHGAGAASRFPGTYYLDWRGEIDMLIENGIDWLEFCIPDEHSHSTELAGYVGAHMIFRALFGECPIVSARPSLKYDETIEILRPYIRHGALQEIAEEDIFYLG